MIGLLSGFSPAGSAESLAAFRQGLSEAGFTEHQNIGIEYRWAEGRYERLPAMAADLVRRQVALILTMPTAAALAAKTATSTIPVVFLIAGDPVQIGLVSSLNRPGGNITGATFYAAQLGSPSNSRCCIEFVPEGRDHRRARQPKRTRSQCRAAGRGLRTRGECPRLRLHVLKCRR